MEVVIVLLLALLMIIRKSDSIGFRTISPSFPKDRPNKERYIKTVPTTKTVPSKGVPTKEVE